jgi:ABC-2 type transport system permease protein
LPLELFPDVLERVAQVLPFSMMVYAPARTFVDPDLGVLPTLLARQALTLAAALALAGLLFRYAVRRLQTNGG